MSLRQEGKKVTVLAEAWILIILECRAVAKKREQKEVCQETSEVLFCVCFIDSILEIISFGKQIYID